MPLQQPGCCAIVDQASTPGSSKWHEPRTTASRMRKKPGQGDDPGFKRWQFVLFVFLLGTQQSTSLVDVSGVDLINFLILNLINVYIYIWMCKLSFWGIVTAKFSDTSSMSIMHPQLQLPFQRSISVYTPKWSGIFDRLEMTSNMCFFQSLESWPTPI